VGRLPSTETPSNPQATDCASMYAILVYDSGRVILRDTRRFFAPNFLPRGVVHVYYYHGKIGGAKRMAHRIADKHKQVVKRVRELKSGDHIKNSWGIMEEQGYILG
jgi:hypothetical protein